MNIGNRSAGIYILLGLDILFFATAVALSCFHGVTEALDDKVWEAFAGANGALLLILKADSDRIPDTSHMPPNSSVTDTSTVQVGPDPLAPKK